MPIIDQLEKLIPAYKRKYGGVFVLDREILDAIEMDCKDVLREIKKTRDLERETRIYESLPQSN